MCHCPLLPKFPEMKMGLRYLHAKLKSVEGDVKILGEEEGKQGRMEKREIP